MCGRRVGRGSGIGAALVLALGRGHREARRAEGVRKDQAAHALARLKRIIGAQQVTSRASSTLLESVRCVVVMGEGARFGARKWISRNREALEASPRVRSLPPKDHY